MAVFKPDLRKEAEALLRTLQDLKANILSLELRTAFLDQLAWSAERWEAVLRDRPDTDPHKAIASMLRTASQGLREDEFTGAKIEALQRCLVVLGAPRMAQEEVENCRSKMLWAGLLGFGFSGGRRVTVDGKY